MITLFFKMLQYDTEVQRKERERLIILKTIEQDGEPKLQQEKERSSETEDLEKQCLATLKTFEMR